MITGDGRQVYDQQGKRIPKHILVWAIFKDDPDKLHYTVATIQKAVRRRFNVQVSGSTIERARADYRESEPENLNAGLRLFQDQSQGD